MDALVVTAKLRAAENSLAKADLYVELEIGALLLVNYDRYDLGVDLVELAQSVESSGEYFVVTCSCGDAGCAGIDDGIAVAHDAATVRWQFPHAGYRPHLAGQVFTFDRAAYAATIRRGLRAFMRLYASQPDCETTPYMLKNRIDEAQRQDWFAQLVKKRG